VEGLPRSAAFLHSRITSVAFLAIDGWASIYQRNGRTVGKQEVETSAPFDEAELAKRQQTPMAWRLSCSMLAAVLPHFPGLLQRPVALRVNLLLPPANMSFGVM
jgi:hypothetical protein